MPKKTTKAPPRRDRALAFPRAFSIMVGLLTGKVMDVLRVLASTETYRASAADVSRRLILKGMAVEAAEYAMTYRTGRPVELLTGLLDEAHRAMGQQSSHPLPHGDPDVVLQAVLSRMWPEVVEAMQDIDTRTAAGREAHIKLLAGPPLTRLGRPMTAEEIRAQALEEVVAGTAEEPKLVPPRSVQEAQERARQHTAADRLAMNRGVSAETLLANTAIGRAAGLTAPDETAGAQGWSDLKTGQGQGFHTSPEAQTLSAGQMLKKIRGEQ
jgi:hypothetical protein